VTAALWSVAAIVAGLSAHAWVNARLLRRPQQSPVDRAVSVLLPVRDEVHRVRACLESLLAQENVANLEILVLDDGSTDGTVDLVRAIAARDDRVTVLAGTEPPPGWYGKPHACTQLAAHATGEVLVFVDADVVLAPHAVSAAVGSLDGVDLVSPYPRLIARSAGERLIQPLLPWSWLTFLPVRAMERSRRPSLAAAGGQFLAVTRTGYDRAGGHNALRDEVLEDIALARAIKRSGGRIRLADGSSLAECRMYGSWAELRSGYQKSLWAAFGSPFGAAAVALAFVLLYVVPPLVSVAAAIAGNGSLVVAGAVGYALAVHGRIGSARATGGRAWPDPLAHPISVVLFVVLLADSYRARRHGSLSWKGRELSTQDQRH
jgi:hypothetical protein